VSIHPKCYHPFYGKSPVSSLTAKAMTKLIALIIIISMVGQKISAQSDTSTGKDIIGSIGGCIDIRPKYPGGHKAMDRLFANNIKYPKTISGLYLNCKVVITFRVDTLGNITDIKVSKSFQADYDREAVRLIGLLKYWVPGTINGKKTDHYLSQPISFRVHKTTTARPQKQWSK
jgi:TonB family protein